MCPTGLCYKINYRTKISKIYYNIQMNKFFITAVIFFSFLGLIWHFYDVYNYPMLRKATIDVLNNFPKEFPDIKSVGFTSDNDEVAHIIYRIQNTIMPVFVEYGSEKGTFFCYSQDGYCGNLIQSNKAELLKFYSNELFLFRETELK